MGEKGLRRWSGGGHVSPSEVRRTRLKYQLEEWAEETGERGGQQVAWTSQGSLRGSRLHGDVGSRQPDRKLPLLPSREAAASDSSNC